MRMKELVLGLAIAGAGLSAMPGRAAVVLNDTFTYNDGALVGQGGWTQTGATATNPIQVIGGKVTIGNTGQDVYDALSSSVPHTDGNSIFTGIDLSVSTALSGGDYFLHLSDPVGTSSNFYQRLFAKSSGSGYVLGLTDTAGTGSTTDYGSTILTFNTTYHVVVAWDFVNGGTNSAHDDTFQVFVNPTSSTRTDNTVYLNHTWSSTTGSEPAQISAANFRQGTITVAPSEVVDNLVVGTDFSDVVAATVVPEPSVICLGGIGVLLGLARRRRQSA